MKLIQTTYYLLLVDEKATIVKYGDYIYREDFDTVSKHINDNPEKLWQGCYKIVAYYPLTKEAKELDLPLLPKPFEEVDKSVELANNYVNKEYKDYAFKDLLVDIFLEGYKAAQQSNKQFSLEDVEGILIKYLEEGFISKEQGYINPKTFLQSLSTQQTYPKEFIPILESYCKCRERGYKCGSLKPETDAYCIQKLKTVTNSEGKEEIQGTYKY